MATTPIDQAAETTCLFNNIPIIPNVNFTGRDDELSVIRKELDPDIPGGDHQYKCVTLAGKAGVGKTELAVQYAHERIEKGTQIVIWIHGDSEKALAQSFKKVVDRLELSDASTPAARTGDQGQALVMQWLGKCETPWLVVFDNLTAPDSTRGHQPSSFEALPISPTGSVLVTTRTYRAIPGLPPDSNIVPLPPLPIDEATRLLLELSNQGEPLEQQQHDAASQLAVELEGQPLAITLVGAHTARHVGPLTVVRNDIQDRLASVASHFGERGPFQGWPTGRAALEMIFRSLRPDEVKIMAVSCSLTCPNCVPYALFSPSSAHRISVKHPWRSPFSVDLAIQALVWASLMIPNYPGEKEKTTYRINRAVQEEFRS
ncbi:P-loop containing nucleoside triphosphate hydrolase protein [Cladorrhinum sp. PSN259]|nr:P-loop containing nucleoside triphosphate hydrolase protein [Cladorrhinum sp. PSN259]